MQHGPRDQPELACLDGVVALASETTIPVVDEGFLRGDGVFEVVAVYGGRAFALDRHLARLARSGQNSLLGYPIDLELLEHEATELLTARGEKFSGSLRIVLTRGGRRLLMTEPPQSFPECARLALVAYSPTRLLDGVKSLSYAANMIAGRMARERGFDEALLVTPHGRVLEAPTASFFYALDDGVLSTPPLDEHILASITRELVMEMVDVRERGITVHELLTRTVEAFLVSTTREIQPVDAIEDRELTAIGPGTTAVVSQFREGVRRAL